MDSRQDKIPTWVGRAVTTSELSAVDPDAGGQNDIRPTNVSRHDVSAGRDGLVDGDEGGRAVSGDADSPTGQPESKPESSESKDIASRRSSPAALIGAVLAVTMLVAAGMFLLSRPSGETTAEVRTNADDQVESDAEQASSQRSDVDEAAVTASDAEVGVATEEDSTDSTTGSRAGADRSSPLTEFAVPGVSTAALEAHRAAATAEGQPAWAIYSDGRIYLQGSLPDDSVADELTGRLQALLGAGNVVEQYVLETGAPTPTDPPLFIKETVVFGPDSATMPPGSDWILVIADVLLNRYPNTDLTVVANGVDSAAGVTADLQLERAEAILAYLTERGIDASRLDYEYRSGATFGADSGNKPIEFVVRGLVDPLNG